MIALISALLAALIIHSIWLYKTKGLYRLANTIMTKATQQAQEEIDKALFKSKDIALEARYACQQKEQELLAKYKHKEQQLLDKEGSYEKKQKELQRQTKHLLKSQEECQLLRQSLENQQIKLTQQEEEVFQQLCTLHHMTPSSAEAWFLTTLEKKYHHQALVLGSAILQRKNQETEQQLQEMILSSLQKLNLESANTYTTCTIKLPHPSYKKRIVGKDGKNIRTFEKSTGVDVLMDDIPDAIILSSFDPLKKEIAKQSLEHLIKDGHIYPTKIEATVQQMQIDLAKVSIAKAKTIAESLLLPPLKHPLLEALGQLHFRYSYGQNVLHHVHEVAVLMGLMAAELGLDVLLARRIGLLHDLGKGLPTSHEGSHALAGASFVAQQGESPLVVNGIASHHNEVPFETTEAYLCQIADRLSGGRSGARQERLEQSIKRVEELETIALEFPEIAKAHVLKAGKEMLIILKQQDLCEDTMHAVAANLIQQIEQKIPFAGTIKITVIREKQTVYFAR